MTRTLKDNSVYTVFLAFSFFRNLHIFRRSSFGVTVCHRGRILDAFFRITRYTSHPRVKRLFGIFTSARSRYTEQLENRKYHAREEPPNGSRVSGKPFLFPIDSTVFHSMQFYRALCFFFFSLPHRFCSHSRRTLFSPHDEIKKKNFRKRISSGNNLNDLFGN